MPFPIPKEKELPTTVLGSAFATSFDVLTESNSPTTPFNQNINLSASKQYYHSPSSQTLVHCVNSSVSSKSGGLGKLIGELIDTYFSRDEQCNQRVNAVDKIYGGKRVVHGQLDPVRIAIIKEKVQNVYKNEWDCLSEADFNEIVYNRGRKLRSRFLKKIGK